MPTRFCESCLTKYYERRDGTKPHSCVAKKKGRKGDRSPRVLRPCAWIGCEESVSVILFHAVDGSERYRMDNGKVKYPICLRHRQLMETHFGLMAKRNGIGASLRGLDEPFGREAPSPAPLTRLIIFDRGGQRCEECSTMLDWAAKNWVIDHRIPLMDGGPTTFRNMRPLCLACDEVKTKSEQRRAGRGYRRPT